MYFKQSIKDEKALGMDFFSFGGEAFHLERKPFYVFLLQSYQFLIKKRLFGLKKRYKSSILKNNGFDNLTENIKTAETLRFEISYEKMNALLTQRQICAADIRCLDTNSKQYLKQFCLKNCLYCTTQTNPVPLLVDELNLADSKVQRLKL